jgi:5,6-dimethylbenzimidazole synthase
MNNLLELMLSRRDVRGSSFLSTAIQQEHLDLILKSALAAPSVGYSQPWEFILIHDDTTKDKIYKNFKKENTKAKDVFKEKALYQDLKLEGIKEAPLNIAVLFKENEETILGTTSMDKMGEYSVVCAIQNMWLMARSLEIGMGWVSILDEKEVLQTLHVPPSRKLIAYLCLGYVKAFQKEPELKTLKWEKEKSLKDLIHLNTFTSS